MTIKDKIAEQKATKLYEDNKNNKQLQDKWLKTNKITICEAQKIIPEPYSGGLKEIPTNDIKA